MATPSTVSSQVAFGGKMTNDDIDKLNPKQVVELMQMDIPLARARRAFYSNMAVIEQLQVQGEKLDIIGQRKMEFKAVIAIAKELGVEI